jgi:hypothetical protein
LKIKECQLEDDALVPNSKLPRTVLPRKRKRKSSASLAHPCKYRDDATQELGSDLLVEVRLKRGPGDNERAGFVRVIPRVNDHRVWTKVRR